MNFSILLLIFSNFVNELNIFYLKGDISQIHDTNAHVLQHGELLS